MHPTNEADSLFKKVWQSFTTTEELGLVFQVSLFITNTLSSVPNTSKILTKCVSSGISDSQPRLSTSRMSEHCIIQKIHSNRFFPTAPDDVFILWLFANWKSGKHSESFSRLYSAFFPKGEPFVPWNYKTSNTRISWKCQRNAPQEKHGHPSNECFLLFHEQIKWRKESDIGKLRFLQPGL